MLIKSLDFWNILAEEFFNTILVKWFTIIKMVLMLHYAILTNESSMIAAEVICKVVSMIIAEYLQYILILGKHFSDLLINLQRKLLLSVYITVTITMAVCALKVIFLCYASLSILRRLNHLGFHTSFAGSHCTAHHKNRLSRRYIESLLALKTFQKTL